MYGWRLLAEGDFEKSHPWDFSTREAKIEISASLHFQALGRLKMAGHPCPARAPWIFQGALRMYSRYSPDL
jgi:hypothetical protein